MTTRIRCQAYYVHTVIRITSLRQPTCCSLIIAEFIFSGLCNECSSGFHGYCSIFRLEGDSTWNIIQLTHMKRTKAIISNRSVDAKANVLGQHGALHPHPEQVRDEVFKRNEFFDSRDLVQVRYEMLRRRQVDGRPVTDVAMAFGVSRQAFYVTEAAFAQEGIVGLLPRPRGPQRAHKCTDEILDFVEQLSADSHAGRDIGEAVRKRFGVAIHPRSLSRALARRKKNQG